MQLAKSTFSHSANFVYKTRIESVVGKNWIFVGKNKCIIQFTRVTQHRTGRRDYPAPPFSDSDLYWPLKAHPVLFDRKLRKSWTPMARKVFSIFFKLAAISKFSVSTHVFYWIVDFGVHFITLEKNSAAVIRSASQSFRDEGDPYYCFRSLDSMKLRSGPVLWALIVCRLVLGVFWQPLCSWLRSKFSVVIAKVFRKTNYGPLSSMQLILTDCLSLELLQDGPRSDLCCYLHELAVEISCCAQYVIDPNFLLAHLTKIRQSDRRTELWSRAGELIEDFGSQLPDRCAATDRCVATYIS